MRTILATFVILAACGGSGGTPASSSSSPRSEASEARASSEGSSAPDGEARSRAPESAPPRVTIGGVPERDSRAIAITLVNRDASEARLAPAVRVELEVEGAWRAVPGIGAISLRMDCAAQPPECVSLVPGAELHPPAWLGTMGDAQCACERCTPAEPGRYRFVIESCDGHRIEGVPFEITSR